MYFLLPGFPQNTWEILRHSSIPCQLQHLPKCFLVALPALGWGLERLCPGLPLSLALLCGPGASPPAKPELLYGGVFRATRAELMPMNQNHVNSKFSFPSIPLHSCLQECLKVICPQGHRSVKRLFFRRYA